MSARRPSEDRTNRARRVLDIEVRALAGLRDRLDASFTRALDLLLACRGKIVVTGIGKAGIVGRKIAATLASTGSSAVFLHAAEGSHGDAGTLARGDVVLAISYSGETEVLQLLPVIRRFDVPLIAMTGSATSSLARAADVMLDVSVTDEGCPLGLAPMASTTTMMALGDALAASLVEERGFTAEDFALLHPGGALGRKLVRVDDLMHSGEEMPVVAETASLKDVLVEMTTKRLGITAVVDAAGGLAGIVTDGDLRRGLERAADIRTLTARDLMTRTPKTIAGSAIGGQALAVMERHKITALVVLGDGSRKPLGVIHLHDLLRAGIV
ncbi:MAG TPA: KpsF/GutQ family sugar-phosphate isomerase [Candidatus Eisenbacteria bacterium]|nr:KpsF/GutQ family sugar-phosphate isomerase [Candidatus Eisenbacteria bacterium]